MKRNLNQSKLDSDNHGPPETHKNNRCGTCGEELEQPLSAELSSGHLIEEYYACPRCLSKVGDIERPKKVEAKDAVEDNQFQKREIEADKKEEAAVCFHFLGYLKKRQKNSPIPEECLTCNTMIRCISF